MQPIVRLTAMLALAGAFAFLDAAPALARGAVSNILNSPGYQRRLQESRQQLSPPVVQTPVVPSRKARHHRRHRH